MIYLEIPTLASAIQEYDKIKLQGYRIYSSIFEATPKASFKFASDYVMPELLGLTVGSALPVQYVTNTRNTEDSNNEEQLDEEPSDSVSLAGLCVQSIDPEGTVGSDIITTVTCTGEYDFFQNSRIRKAYTAKYGNEVVDDVLESNRIMKDYDRDIQKTDNTSTVYRTLGEADVDFVTNVVAKQYIINGGKPLFYTSLDKIIHFTSVNNLTENVKKTKLLLSFNPVYDDASREFVQKNLKNYIDEEDTTSLNVLKWKMHIGGKDATPNIKNSAYFTDFENGAVTSSAITFSPALKSKAYFPIDAFFMETTNSTQAVAVYNRPTSTIFFEAKNYFDSFESLITIDVEIQEIQALNRLVLAGETVTVVTPFPYSIYNGNYLVAAVEYGLELETNFMKLKLIRANVDTTWSDGISTNKSSENFKYPFVPALNKSMYYNV